MQDAGLFTDLAPVRRTKRRNSPVEPSKEALAVVDNLVPAVRAMWAQEIVHFLDVNGIDRNSIAALMRLSRSSTSHWFHAANSISRHNLAVLVDVLIAHGRPSCNIARNLLQANASWAELCTGSLHEYVKLLAKDRDNRAELTTLLERVEDHIGRGLVSVYPEPSPDPTPPVDCATPMTWGRRTDGAYVCGPMVIEASGTGYKVTAPGGRRLLHVEVATLADAFALCHELEAGL